MSLIKIKHYRREDLSRDIEQQLNQLSSNSLSKNSLASYIEQYGNNPDRESHYYLITNNTVIFGFAFFSIKEEIATLHTLFIKDNYRKKSLGSKLVLHLLSKASKHNCRKMTLSCTIDTLHFFNNLGFVALKEPSTLTNTTQFELENACPEYFLSVYNQSKIENQQYKSETKHPLVLSKDRTLYNFHDEAQHLALHRNMLSQAQRKIWITSNSIKSPILSDDQFCQSIMKLVKTNPQAEIRILIENEKMGAGHFNPLINLAQRLTSYVEIRTLDRTAGRLKEMVTIVDFTAGIYRKSMSSYTGFATYNSHLISRRLHDKFENYWQFAMPSIEFRRLAI